MQRWLLAQYSILQLKINVPLDSPGGYYQGKIAFTDDIVPYTEDYIDPQYVNSNAARYLGPSSGRRYNFRQVIFQILLKLERKMSIK